MANLILEHQLLSSVVGAGSHDSIKDVHLTLSVEAGRVDPTQRR